MKGNISKSIAVESTLGVGSVFIVRLPIRVAQEKQELPTQKNAEYGKFNLKVINRNLRE
jgi:hypothetical protein